MRWRSPGYALVHGAVFVALKTEGECGRGPGRLALRIAPVALLPLVALLLVVQLRVGLGVDVGVRRWWCWPRCGAVAGCAAGREGQAFALMGAGDRRDGGDAVRRAVPERASVHSGRGVLADDRRTPRRARTR